MASMMALIGSIVIGGIFLLGLMNYYNDVTVRQQEQVSELLTQEAMATFAEILEFDFNKMGSGLNSPSGAVVSLVAGNTDITFRADVDDDGEAETIRYYTANTAESAATENPNDVTLYRLVDGTTTIAATLGVISCTFTLRDMAQNVTTDFSQVACIEIDLTVESMNKMPKKYTTTAEFSRALWHPRITPPNMIRITNTNN